MKLLYAGEMLSAQCDISFRSSVCFYFRTLFRTMSGPLLPDFQTYFRNFILASRLLPDRLPDFQTCLRIRFQTSGLAPGPDSGLPDLHSGLPDPLPDLLLEIQLAVSGLPDSLPDQLPDLLPDQLPDLLPHLDTSKHHHWWFSCGNRGNRGNRKQEGGRGGEGRGGDGRKGEGRRGGSDSIIIIVRFSQKKTDSLFLSYQIE